MKKKILGGLLIVAIATVAAFNVNMNTDKNELSLLALANVEALGGSIAEDSNNSTGYFWKKYAYDCTIDAKIRVTRSCGSFSVGTIYYGASIAAEISACGGSYESMSSEKGIKDYCFNGTWVCWSNNDCH